MTGESLVSLFEGFVEYEGIYLKSGPSLGLLKRAESDAVDFYLKNMGHMDLQIFSSKPSEEISFREYGLRTYLKRSIDENQAEFNRLADKWGREVLEAWLKS